MLRYRSLGQGLSRHLCSLLLALLVLLALAQPARAAAWSPQDRQLAQTKCIIGYERFVPAHYYYCLGLKEYGLQHYERSQHFFDESARWGSKQAEYVLGVMTLHGDHQPANPVQALAWFSLAAERHTPMFEQAYQDLRKQLSPAQLAQARQAASDLGPAYTDAIAASRAEQRYRLGMHWLQDNSGDQNICLSGMIDWGSSAGEASPQTAAAAAGRCPSPAQLKVIVNDIALGVFDQWGGHVTIGPLQVVHQGADGSPNHQP